MSTHAIVLRSQFETSARVGLVLEAACLHAKMIDTNEATADAVADLKAGAQKMRALPNAFSLLKRLTGGCINIDAHGICGNEDDEVARGDVTLVPPVDLPDELKRAVKQRAAHLHPDTVARTRESVERVGEPSVTVGDGEVPVRAYAESVKINTLAGQACTGNFQALVELHRVVTDGRGSIEDMPMSLDVINRMKGNLSEAVEALEMVREGSKQQRRALENVADAIQYRLVVLAGEGVYVSLAFLTGNERPAFEKFLRDFGISLPVKPVRERLAFNLFNSLNLKKNPEALDSKAMLVGLFNFLNNNK